MRSLSFSAVSSLRTKELNGFESQYQKIKAILLLLCLVVRKPRFPVLIARVVWREFLAAQIKRALVLQHAEMEGVEREKPVDFDMALEVLDELLDQEDDDQVVGRPVEDEGVAPAGLHGRELGAFHNVGFESPLQRERGKS